MKTGRGASSCPVCGSGGEECSEAWLRRVKGGAAKVNMARQKIRLAQIRPCNPETLEKL